MNAHAHTGQSEGLLTTTPYRRPLLVAGLWGFGATVVSLLLPAWWAVVTALCVPIVLLCHRCRRFAVVLAVIPLTLCLFFGGVYRLTRVAPVVALDGCTDSITGYVVERDNKGAMVTLQVSEAQLVPKGTLVAMYCPDEVSPALGDTVTSEVDLLAYDYRRGVGVHLYAFPIAPDEEHVLLDTPDRYPLNQCLLPLAERLSVTLAQVLDGEDSALLSALCLGDAAYVSASVEMDFRHAGLSHVLVVSGLHLSLVAVAMRLALRRIHGGMVWSSLTTMPVLLMFVGVVGASASVVRAAVMCLIWLAGIALFRSSDGLNSLGLAAVLILLNNPYALLSAGFQLSFLATAGVLWLAPHLCRRLPRWSPDLTGFVAVWRRVMVYAGTALATCVSALLFTLPVACYHYGGCSLTAPVSNLLAVVPAGWALLLGWLGMLCCLTPLLSWLGKPLLMAAGYLARFLRSVAAWCSPDGAYASVTDWWQLVLVGGLCLVLIVALRFGVSRRRVAVCLTTLLVLVTAVSLPLMRQVTRVTLIPSDWGVAVHVTYNDYSALIATHSGALEDAYYSVSNPVDVLYVTEGRAKDLPYIAPMCAPDGALYTVENSAFAGDQPLPVTVVSEGDVIPLWEGFSLTLLPDGWCRLDTHGGTLLVASDPTATPPEQEGLAVYGGLPECWPQGYCIASIPTRVLAKHRPVIPENTLVLTEEDSCVTFTTRGGGDWSVLPWQQKRN